LVPIGQGVSGEKICLTLKLLGQMEPNLAGSIYVRSSIKYLRFIPFGQQIWLPKAILVSDWLMLNKFSPLKLLGKIEPNLAGSIYVRSSIKLLHLVSFGQQTWPPRAILLMIVKKLYRVSYIDVSCQVWFQLAKEFQGRRFV
jgi:hypothetical protein